MSKVASSRPIDMAAIQTSDAVPPAEISAELNSQRLFKPDLQVERPVSLSSMGMAMGPTTSHSEHPNRDVSTICPDPSQHASLPVQDLSRWHAQRRPFLIDTIQRQTEQNIKAIALNKRILRQYLKQQLEQCSRRDDEHLTTLNLVQATGVGDQVLGDRSSTRLTANSDSSVNSMSSQMSDSFLNDVQQSAALLKVSLNAIMAYLPSLPRRKIVSFFGGGSVEGHLAEEVRGVRQRLSQLGPQMSSIGFSDVALKLNEYNEQLKDDVLKFLALENKYARVELRKRLDQTNEWKPWKSHLRPSKWKPKDEYGFLAERVHDLGMGMRRTLESALLSRDVFVSMATKEMNSIVLDFAEVAGFKVLDKWDGNTLVERIFEKEHLLLSQDVTLNGT